MKINSSKLSYRAEIDGLRAIAVVSIILYHAQLVFSGRNWFEGGYIGVDIFFVISGYLITRIILYDLQIKDTFSFLNFYERRARRILPMLFVVIIVSIPFAWQNLLSKEFEEYAKSILTSIFFSSNFFFYFSTIEYGADSALLKPFLHTWSLGIEEQFYLLFPILTIFTFKFFHKYFLTILLGLSLLSLQFAELMEVRNSELNFFLPFSRFWELAVGSLLAYREQNYKTSDEGIGVKILPMLGLYLIIYSILFFDEKTPHPSFQTLIPIIGVSLIIWFSSKDELVGKVLSSKPLVWIGLISYSAYLWHFPIFAFYRIGLFDEEMGIQAATVMIILTFLLSFISYKLIEKPFRSKVSTKTFLLSISFAFVIIISISSYIILSNGVSSVLRLGFDPKISNFNPNIITTAEPSYLYGDDKVCDSKDAIYFNETQFCVIGDTNKPKVDFFLVGDSHAMYAQPLLKKISERFNMKGIFGGNSGCLPLLGIYPLRGSPHPNDWSKRCYGFNQNGYEFVKTNNVNTVFLVARWDYYVDGANKGELNNISGVDLKFGDINQTRQVYNEAVKRTFEKYKAIGVKVIVVLQVPHQNKNIKRFFEKLLKYNDENDRNILFAQALKDGVSLQEHLLRQKIASSVWRNLGDTHSKSELIIIDPSSDFCSADICRYITHDYALYTDTNHPSEQGYDRLEAKFTEALGL